MNGLKRGVESLPAVLLALVVTVSVASAAEKDNAAAYATPPGITLVDMVMELFLSRPLPMWTHVADAKGRALYVYDGDEPGKSNCGDACAGEFEAMLAPNNARESGDWSLVEREGGKFQWAYQGKPLYRFLKETGINEVAENLVKKESLSGLRDTTSTRKQGMDVNGLLFPPEGWQIAKFQPASTIDTPAAIRVKDIAAAGVSGLVDARGMTLYAFAGQAGKISDCKTECNGSWQVLEAGEMANPVGPFAPVRGEDGVRQWAYNKAPLFTYRGDLIPGDINGLDDKENENSDWYIPALITHFTPPAVSSRQDPVKGIILTTSEGLPLYMRYHDQSLGGTRTDFLQSSTRGKQMGTKGCNAECEQTWRPFLAGTDDQSRGYWEVVERGDGTRQWAYRGFMQYINVNDQPNAKVTRSNVYDYVVGGYSPYKPEDVVLDYGKRTNGYRYSGIVWRVSSP